MAQIPTAVGLMVCEQVIIEEKTRKVTVVNSFTRHAVKQVPAELFPFVVYAVLTDGIGDMPLTMRINRLDTDEEIYHLSRSFRFAEPLQQVRCIFRVRDCTFPIFGYYEVAILAEDEIV